MARGSTFSKAYDALTPEYKAIVENAQHTEMQARYDARNPALENRSPPANCRKIDGQSVQRVNGSLRNFS